MSEPSRSESLYRRAVRVLPGGVSRNAVLRRPHPVYAAFGEGCRVTDIDGVRRLDFANNMASLIHGHAHPAIVRAVEEQVRRGTAFTLATEVEVEFAEHMTGRSPSFEMIRFVNSGTEAIMCCIKAARAFTGRPMIAKVEGAYHGLYDYAEVSQTATPADWGEAERPASVPVCAGTPASALAEVVVLPFNDAERAVALLDRHADRIACVLLDPMPHRVGLAPATEVFVDALQRWTRANSALLVFDEVITFRCGYGGAQDRYTVRPDLTALGKIIGGGFPIGAIAGRREVMEVLNPLRSPVLFPHSGTFSANPVSMTAGLTAMRLFDRAEVARLNRLGSLARERIAALIAEVGVPACVTGDGSMFRVHMKPEPPSDYRAAYPSHREAEAAAALVNALFRDGIMLIGTCTGTLSTPMTEREIDALCEALRPALLAVAPLLDAPHAAARGG
ncbi:MAG TPA: aspartate aminotransferase family protein [Phycisphaerales bacterium]|nr:aspartate aminotransferase family protein [Phycisphaerales bacterium]